MPNGGPTDELLRRLLAAVAADGSGERIDQLIADARAEAAAEVKALVKASYKAALLRAATEQLEDRTSDDTQSPSPTYSGETAGERREPRETAVTAGHDEPPPSQPPASEVQPIIDPPRPSPLSPALSPAHGEEGVAARADETGSPSDVAGCYVYAITPAAPQDWTARERGVDPRCPLQVVAYEDLQAIVSPVSLEEFGQAALNERVSDPAWVEDKVRAHDHVVRSAMSAGAAVIPCRFCTVVRSPDDVRMLLAAHRDGIAATLASLRGKQEWGVKVYADVAAVAREIAAGGGAGAGDAKASGKAYLRRKQNADAARSEADHLVRAHADECHRTLAEAASEATVLPRRPRAAGTGEADPVHNAAYLVAEQDVAQFHETVAALAERYRPFGVTFDVSGPWPPYNFVRLDLSLQAVA